VERAAAVAGRTVAGVDFALTTRGNEDGGKQHGAHARLLFSDRANRITRAAVILCFLEVLAMRRLSLLALLGFISVFICATAARADWPVARHDGKRSATGAPGASSIAKPAPYWRIYLGGSLNRRAYLTSDVNLDGKVEVVYVAGGKVIAKLADDTVVWESPPVGITTLVGIDDLDGDGNRDVAAFSDRQAFLISGKDGSIEWEEAEGEMGTVGGVRMGDLDGDGKQDLFIDECGCCGVNSGSPGVYYSFSGGFQNAATPKWTSPAHGHCGASGDTLGDFDGDGKVDLGYSSYGAAQMVRGSDGSALGTSNVTGTRVDTAVCDSANVDGRAGDEMICYQDIYQASGNVGGHQTFAVTYDPNANPPVKILWQHALGDLVNDRLISLGNSLADLDKDGKYEVTVSEYDGGIWLTKVYDAATGTQLTSLSDAIVAAIVDLDGDGKPELITSASANGDLVAHGFDRSAQVPLSTRWTLSGKLSAPVQQDWNRTRKSGADSRALALDLDSDGKLEPVFFVPGQNGMADALTAFHAAGNQAPTVAASFLVPQDVTLLTHDVFPMVNRAYDQLLVTRDDGFLIILDNAFKATNNVMDGEFPVPGMRIGGYYSGAYGDGRAPIAPHLDGKGDSVIVDDSRGALLRIDPVGATLLTPPAIAWTALSTVLPTAVDKLAGGQRGLAVLSGGLTALDASGKQLWHTAVPGIYFEPLAGDVNGDGVPDLFVETVTNGSTAGYQVFDGKSGSAIWKNPVSEALMWGGEPSAVGDWDGNGTTDLYVVLNTPRIFSGADGTTLASNPSFLGYFEPTLADIDGDGSEDITFSGGYYPVRTYGHDLNTPLYTSADDDRPYAYGARAACPGNVSVWVQASLQTPGLVRVTPMNGAMAGVDATLFLAEGATYPTAAAAKAAGKHLGTVGNATIKNDLTGANTHPSALLGSTDGWLYALDACNLGLLDWSYNFHFPVGEASFADTSGDGVDEIVVTAADGYLYGLSQELIPAPGYVWDLDPAKGNMDVDAIATYDTLYASWPAVPGADSYEVAVLTTGGSFVTQPNWQNVGNVTQVAQGGLPLVDGKKYLFAVRAVSNAKGSSVEAVSNGVTVTLTAKPVPDFGGTGGTDLSFAGDGGSLDFSGGQTLQVGCSCEVGARGTRGGIVCFALALVILLFARARRERL
jgi:hypothetical protein